MSLDSLISNNLNGEVIHDGIMIAVIFIIIIIFYKELFSAVFSIFKK